MPLAGIQADEALFGSPLFSNIGKGLLSRLRHPGVPSMLMTYLGTLKTWLYWLWLDLAPANVWTIRLPMVFAGAATIFVFFKLVEQSVRRRAALIGAFLLAFDPMFLLTATFDWGPVAIEHLLLVTGCFCLFRYGAQYERRATPGEPFWHGLVWGRDRLLALGLFLLGLGLWNKAIFAWAIAGLMIASAFALWPFVGRELRVRTLAIAAVAFLAGASPVILYNLQQSGATVGQNANFDPLELADKWLQVKATLNGNALFGYITAEFPAGRHQSGMYYGMGVILLLVPLWWRSRAAWFSLIFCTVSWLLMATTKGAGTSVHHVILLWPFPILFASVVLGRLPKYAGAAATVGIVIAHLLVLQQYLLEFRQHGTGLIWTDAIFTLSDELKAADAKNIYVTDWGILDSVHLLHKGDLRLYLASGPLMSDSPSLGDLDVFGRMMDDPSGIFVGHVRDREVFAEVGKHMDALAARAGKRRNVLKTIADSRGRPTFEISVVQ